MIQELEKNMKLQLALDIMSYEQSLALIEKVADYIDIVEIGTPFILEEGMKPVRDFKKRFPQLKVFADTKIMDAGDIEATSAFKAGADIATVLGVTDIATIISCIEAAKKFNKKIVVDMICVNNMEGKIKELERIGVNGLAVHTGVDQQKSGRTPIDDLKVMKKISKKSEIYVAGGIELKTIGKYTKYYPDVLIVGGGICSADNPALAAKLISEKIKSV